MSSARLVDLGKRPYREVWELQHRLLAAVRDGIEPDTWIVVEHLPVITLGRQARRENVLLSDNELRERGVELVAIERGGDVTYHGPGQLVVYPIRRLERFREIVPLVRALEAAVIDACARFGIVAERWEEHAGVFVGEKQICAIGLAVRQMVSLHGIALNVSTELDYDRLINPCGLRGCGVTSLSAEIGHTVAMEHAKRVVLEELGRTFDVTFNEAVAA